MSLHYYWYCGLYGFFCYSHDSQNRQKKKKTSITKVHPQETYIIEKIICDAKNIINSHFTYWSSQNVYGYYCFNYYTYLICIKQFLNCKFVFVRKKNTRF